MLSHIGGAGEGISKGERQGGLSGHEGGTGEETSEGATLTRLKVDRFLLIHLGPILAGTSVAAGPVTNAQTEDVNMDNSGGDTVLAADAAPYISDYLVGAAPSDVSPAPAVVKRRREKRRCRNCGLAITDWRQYHIFPL